MMAQSIDTASAYAALDAAARALETEIARWRRGDSDWLSVSRQMSRTQAAERAYKSALGFGTVRFRAS